MEKERCYCVVCVLGRACSLLFAFIVMHARCHAHLVSFAFIIVHACLLSLIFSVVHTCCRARLVSFACIVVRISCCCIQLYIASASHQP